MINHSGHGGHGGHGEKQVFPSLSLCPPCRRGLNCNFDEIYV